MVNQSYFKLLKNFFIGRARDLSDQRLFHKVALIALFAWVGLGADGLSSSCYGPEESFKTLGIYTSFAPIVALACVITIVVVCISYSQIIEVFPGGGGGYLVASKLLSPSCGVVSGCALLVDYVLTIAMSIASGTDALFSVLPSYMYDWKLAFAFAGIALMTILNLRGVKESILLWVPVFFVFLITHAFAVIYSIFFHRSDIPAFVANTTSGFTTSVSQLGLAGAFFVIVKAYSMGAGTYTGIEAVSNGLPLLREPRVETGKRTMLYMALSLSLVGGGLLLAYLLTGVAPHHGKTLNAVLFETITGSWSSTIGPPLVVIAMLSATLILFIAAQTGFLGGPRVLMNMAMDRWLPSRFASLSDRLVSQNGILLMGLSAAIVLLFTHGSVSILVILYSINVFITFTLSQAGMVKHWWECRGQVDGWRPRIAINGLGFCLTAFILIVISCVKFSEGAWATFLVTGSLIAIAYLTRRHYSKTLVQLARLNTLAEVFEGDGGWDPTAIHGPTPAKDVNAQTAVVLVNGFNGLGVHTTLAVIHMFPRTFKNFIFVQAGVVDAGVFKGSGEIEHLRGHITEEANRYVEKMKRHGFYSEAVTDVGTDLVDTIQELADRVSKEYPQSVFFGGQLVFPHDGWFSRLLHNFVVFALQRRLFRSGVPFLILPIRV
jgi:amino acid transporter